MNACGLLVEKNDMVLCYLEGDNFNFFQKNGIQSLCKVKSSRNICKNFFRNYLDRQVDR